MSDIFLNRRRLLPVVVVILLVVSGCGHGPKVEHGNIEVYYKGGATKEEADRLGAYLKKAWAAVGGRRSVQLQKSGDGYQFRMVVKKEYQNNEAMLRQLQFDAARISRDVFNGAAVEVHACDEQFNTLKSFPPRADVRYGIVQGKAEVFYAAESDKADAQRLTQYLGRGLGDVPGPITFKLARRGPVVEVHMVVQQDKLSDPAVVASLGQLREGIAGNVFKGATVELHLCNEVLNVVQVLKP